MNPRVNFYFEKARKWQEEIALLRKIVLSCGLNEVLRWGCPCYTHGKSNIVLIHVFKDYCALLFFKGVLLKDPEGILVQQTRNVQSARQMRFTGAVEIEKLKSTIETYIQEAVLAEKKGLKVTLKKPSEFPVSEEFRNELDKNPKLTKAFRSLTPGRQRGYLLYFSSAKQAKTRKERVEKHLKRILNGKGLDD